MPKSKANLTKDNLVSSLNIINYGSLERILYCYLKELSADIKGRHLTEMNKPYRFIKATRLHYGVPLS